MDSGPRSYHWTPALERQFLDVLAESGSVHLAARAVAMSPQSARARKRRDPEGAFARGWLAALSMARETMIDAITQAAIDGAEYRRVRSPRTNRMSWRCADPRLGAGKGMALLNRLDRFLEGASKKANMVETFADFRAFPHSGLPR